MTTWSDAERPDRYVVLPPEPVGRPWGDWLSGDDPEADVPDWLLQGIAEGRSTVQPIGPFEEEEPESWPHLLLGLLLLGALLWLLVIGLSVLG
jgi:hypothetical protein